MGPLDNRNKVETTTRKFHREKGSIDIFNSCLELIFHFEERENLNSSKFLIPFIYSVHVQTKLLKLFPKVILYFNKDLSIVSRTQLLSEAVIQIFLAIALFRLYLLLVYVGFKKVTNTPPLMLRAMPCCCWPCLPFPTLEMTDSNLFWLRLLVLQLPIIQVISSFLSFSLCLFSWQPLR